MMSSKYQAPVVKLLKGRLDEWDKGSGSDRQMQLQRFLEEFSNETCEATLEGRLSSGGSLLLARFLVHLQITYRHDRSNQTLLKVLGLFITSADGDRFAAELIEGGLFITLFDIVLAHEVSDVEKEATFSLLVKVATLGRRYKEAICETHGIRVICQTIHHSGSSIDVNKDERYGDGSGTILQVLSTENNLHKSDAFEKRKLAKPFNRKLQLWQGNFEAKKGDKQGKYGHEVYKLPEQSNQHNERDSIHATYSNEIEACSLMFLKARELLMHLANGNPKYQQDLAMHLLKLLDPKNSVATQLVACQVVRVVLPHNLGLCGRALESAANMLGVSKVSLLFEAIQIMHIVALSPWRSELVQKLVHLIVQPHNHTVVNDKQKHPLYITEPDLSDLPQSSGTAAMFKEQADAILALGQILKHNNLDEILADEIVLLLVKTFATTFYPESQRRAATVLRVIVSMSSTVRDVLAKTMPEQVFARLLDDPVDAANFLSVSEARRLQSVVRAKLGEEEERAFVEPLPPVISKPPSP